MVTVSIDHELPGGAPAARMEATVTARTGPAGAALEDRVVGQTRRIRLDAAGHAEIDLDPVDVADEAIVWQIRVGNVTRHLDLSGAGGAVSWADPAVLVLEGPAPTDWVPVQGLQGDPGVVAATGLATYDAETQTIDVTATAADVGAVPTARTITAGTGLTGGGDLSADRTLTVTYGATAGTAAEGNDARLTNARTPTAHAASHQDGGSDELALDGSQITSGTVAAARLGSGTASASTYLRGDQTWADSGQRRPNIGYVQHATSGFDTASLTSGQIRTRLFGPWLPVGWVITGVGVEVTTTGAGAAATVALWEATDRGQPTALLGQAEIGLTALGAVVGTFTAVVPTTPLVVAGIRYHTGVAPQVRTTAHPTPLESAVYALAAPATGTTAAYTAYLSAAVAPNLTLSWGSGGPIRIYLKIEAA